MRRLSFVILAGLVLVASPASASTVATLISSNGTIQEGDLLFSSFQFAMGAGNPGDVFTPTSASGITVQGTTLNGNNGLLFTGPFTAGGLGPLGFPNSANYTIQFVVTVLDPSFGLNNLEQSIGGSFTSPAFADLFTFAADPLHPIISIGDASSALDSIHTSADNSSNTLLFSTTNHSAIHVDAGLQFSAGGADGSLNIPSYTVAFSELRTGPVSAPEPTNALFIGFVFLAIATAQTIKKGRLLRS